MEELKVSLGNMEERQGEGVFHVDSYTSSKPMGEDLLLRIAPTILR